MTKLSLYRRHIDQRADKKENCEYAGQPKARQMTRCDCPVWVDGQLDGKRYHKSMQTTSWAVAEERVQNLSSMTAETRKELASPKVADAVKTFLEESKGTWADNTYLSYDSQLAPFSEYFAGRAVNSIQESEIIRYLDSRRGRDGKSAATPNVRSLRIVQLKAFFGFAGKKEWTKADPTENLEKSAYEELLTQPYSEEEQQRIFEYLDAETTDLAILEMRAFAYLAIFTGLRAIEVGSFQRNHYNRHTGYFTLKNRKGKATIHQPLNPKVVAALDALPKTDAQYFFAGDDREAVTAVLRTRLYRMGDKIGVHVHPHRFRDTFAQEFLATGSLDGLKLALGHKSITTTERHYAHMSKKQQALVDAALHAMDFGQRAPARPFLVHAS